MAKTGQPHAKLEGTVYSAAEQIEAAGGQALPLVGDVRNDDDVAGAVAAAVERFGGIDIVINNASAIDLSKTDAVDMKRYDLMQDINVRGTFLLSKLALPALRESDAGQILTLSPPLNLDPKWAGMHLAYTMAKYGMSLTTLGLAEELKVDGISVNSLWPCTLIDTAAIRNMPGGEQIVRGARGPRNHGRRRPRRADRQQRDPGVRQLERQFLHRRSRSSPPPASRTSPRTAWAPRKTGWSLTSSSEFPRLRRVGRPPKSHFAVDAGCRGVRP